LNSIYIGNQKSQISDKHTYMNPSMRQSGRVIDEEIVFSVRVGLVD